MIRFYRPNMVNDRKIASHTWSYSSAASYRTVLQIIVLTATGRQAFHEEHQLSHRRALSSHCDRGLKLDSGQIFAQRVSCTG